MSHFLSPVRLSSWFAVTAGTLALLWPALSEAQIKQPGAHPKYSVELEPHLVFDWSNHGWGGDDDDAFGPGLRATIPFLDNGPISKINNNMGIGFGLDWAHDGDACGGRWRWKGDWYNDADCEIDVFFLPAVVQWNFFLTPIISVFGEAGLVIQRVSWDVEPCAGDCDGSDMEVDPAFWGGGRFMFGANSSVGGIVRLGWPYISLGVGIML